MGSVTVGDLIIVTSALTSMPHYSYLIGEVFEIVAIDIILNGYPYKIQVGDRSFWVEGVPYSPLMLELL